jgi:chromate transporter
VVGVIANLAVYFAVHTLFSDTRALEAGVLQLELPVLGSLRPVSLGIALAAAVMIFVLRWPVLRTLAACAVLGVAAAAPDILAS